MNPYVQLGIAALMPAVAAMGLYILERRTSFGRISYRRRQIIYGLIFGIFAICGTELGIPIEGATINVRDAAPIIAGLFFGGPAAIVAGLIGGIERWVAVAWGVGEFTRVACSVSTALAGFYAAALRRYMFDDKRPGWLISFAIGIVIEVFHQTMVFVTNMATPDKAMAVVQITAPPMIIATGASVLIAAIGITLLSDHKLTFKPDRTHITQTIQTRLLASVMLALIITSLFVYNLQSTINTSQTDRILSAATKDVAADIKNATDQDLLLLADVVSKEIGTADLDSIAERLNISEICIADKKGVIVDSNISRYIGYDMSKYEQSKAFMCLVEGQESYVQELRLNSVPPYRMRKYAGVSTDDGFVQIGYDIEHFQADIAKQVKDMSSFHHVGTKGFIFILDEQKQVASAPEGVMGDTTFNQSSDGDLKENTTFETTIRRIPYYAQYRKAEGYYIVAAMPKAEVEQTKAVIMYANSFTQVLIMALLFALIYLLIKRVVVNQIRDINSSLAKIAKGNLGVEVNVRSSEEFASLSDDINTTVDTLKRYIDEASARIDQELEFAKTIQLSAMPNQFPAFPKRKDFDIYASMTPAKEVGGDFYDLYLTDNHTLNFVIADVSGKGIGAAMFMMRAKTELKNNSTIESEMGDVFTHSNNALCEGNDAGMFVTAWQGRLDLETGRMTFANAGHNPPLIRHADGQFEYVKTRAGFVLAGMEGILYRTQEMQLLPGDIVYLYTDGVTEATDANNELYGEERLLELLRGQDFTSSQEICEVVRADVDRFVGDAPQFDDITMLALRYIGAKQNPSITIDRVSLEDIPRVTEFVEGELEKLGCPMKTVFQMNVAIDEVYSNIAKFAYSGAEPGMARVEVGLDDQTNMLMLRFEDEGIPYNPLTKEDPDVTLSAEERRVGGLGIFMVKKTMDDVRYEYEDGRNILTLFKKM